MIFCVQASNPRVQNVLNLEDACLLEAIESIFPLNTESALLIWNHISIPLSYKYDLSYMIDDIMKVINALFNENAGRLEISWLPDTFRCDWEIAWSEGSVEIKSQWECTNRYFEKILNENNEIKLTCFDFINEWKEVFRILINGLKNNGYEESKVKGMSELMELYEKIKDVGVLYK